MKYFKRFMLIVFILILISITVLLGIFIGLKYTNNEDTLYSLINNFYTFFPFNTFKTTVITSENYEEINQTIKEKLSEEEACYYSYACIIYITRDGFSDIYSFEQDEEKMYQSIYNKSIQQLIDEGKVLMKENNLTWQQYKESLKELENKLDSVNTEIQLFNQQ